MSTLILKTKLFTPVQREDVILRTRLSDSLDAGLSNKLTLISAPAGFGKTTVVCEWISRSKHPVAWLSLDERDSDGPGSFICGKGP